MSHDIEIKLKDTFFMFYRQDDAFEWALQRPQGRVRVVSFETQKLSSGKRRFLVTDLRKFWQWYKTEEAVPMRHFYELIQEDLPSRLYFDLEYPIESNPGIDPQEMMKDFFALVRKLINEAFDFDVDPDKHFLILDSTSPTKFSAHVIVHFWKDEHRLDDSEMLFPANTVLKPFVQLLCHEMQENKIGLVKNGEKETFICDPSVYSKNRNFRLFLSSKVGKTNVLKLADYCNFYGGNEISLERIFLDSLITPYKYEELELISTAKLVQLVKERLPSQSARTYTRLQIGPRDRKLSQRADLIELASGNGDSSPFPMLDLFIVEFVKNIAKEGGALCPNAQIRIWYIIRLLPSGHRKIQYQFNNYRYCMKIKREHKRQNIYWTIDLETGLVYQRCFDYDCRQFISEYYRVPPEVESEIRNSIDHVFEQLDSQLYGGRESDKPSGYVSIDNEDEDAESEPVEEERETRRIDFFINPYTGEKYFVRYSFYDADKDRDFGAQRRLSNLSKPQVSRNISKPVIQLSDETSGSLHRPQTDPVLSPTNNSKFSDPTIPVIFIDDESSIVVQETMIASAAKRRRLNSETSVDNS